MEPDSSYSFKSESGKKTNNKRPWRFFSFPLRFKLTSCPSKNAVEHIMTFGILLLLVFGKISLTEHKTEV